jgi:rubrerythrin
LARSSRREEAQIEMARKLTIQQVKEIFAAANFELLTSSYKSSKQPLEYSCKICDCKGTTRLEYVKAGRGCPCCWQARRGESHKHNLEFVREKFAAKKLELLERGYLNSKTPLLFRCMECGYRGKQRSTVGRSKVLKSSEPANHFTRQTAAGFSARIFS